MMEEDNIVPQEALLCFAEKCILSPSMLANRLISKIDYDGISFAFPNERTEQIYQILLKWKQQNPQGTWRSLKEATDSGVGSVIRTMSRESSGSDNSPQPQYTPLGLNGIKEEREEGGVQPSAPPHPLVFDTLPPPPPSYRSIEFDEPLPPCCQDDMIVVDFQLTEEDLPDVLQEVIYETKWYDLGLALRLPSPVLDEIKTTNHHIVSDCRRDMISRWLKCGSRIRPSWRALCHALRSPMVGNIAMANRIARMHQILS